MGDNPDVTPSIDHNSTLREEIASFREAVVSMTASIDRLNVNTETQIAQAKGNRRWLIAEVAVVVIAIVLFGLAYRDTHRTLNAVQDATGKEAQERGVRNIETILRSVDTANERNLQDFREQLGIALGKPIPEIHFTIDPGTTGTPDTDTPTTRPTSTTTVVTTTTTTAAPATTSMPTTTTTCTAQIANVKINCT